MTHEAGKGDDQRPTDHNKYGSNYDLIWRKKSGLKSKDKKTASPPKSESLSRRLTQEELTAWWPFKRLDPKRFPKNLKTISSPTEEEALM